MAKIKEYKFLHCGKLSEEAFEKEINKLIESGWQPLGGIAYARVDHSRYFAQAMVKYEPEPIRINGPLNVPNPFIGPGPYVQPPDFIPTCDQQGALDRVTESLRKAMLDEPRLPIAPASTQGKINSI